MASTVLLKERPSVDYFSFASGRSQNSTSVSPPFEWDSSPYNDSALGRRDDSCDSAITSPASPTAITYPDNPYTLPTTSPPDIKSEQDQSFNFGTFEDWMRWDDPSDAALSPSSEFFPDLKLEPLSPLMVGLELQRVPKSKSNSIPDDIPIFGEEAMNEQPLFQTPHSPMSSPLPNTNSPRRESQSLYSTPLSWSRPLPGSHKHQKYTTTLSPEEETKLREIAMPTSRPRPYYSFPSSPELEPENRKKRKSSLGEASDTSTANSNSNSGKGKLCSGAPKKTAHNMIEKRYRTNLNDKIKTLRDSVPALRVAGVKNGGDDYDEMEDLDGLTPAHKLNKATVLSKATEYIAHLEKRNKVLTRENEALKARVDAFETLMGRSGF